MSSQTMNVLNKASSLSVLTQEECQEVRSVVYELKECWLNRSPCIPFYTLGAASYIDAVQEQQDYYRKVQSYNPILRDRLGWLYERLANTLAQFLKAPTSYQHSLALPGFHIFLSCKLFEQPIASIHCDLQYELVNWESKGTKDFTQPISFTLPISLPKFGAGLNIWELNHQEIMKISELESQQLINSRNKNFFPYKVGQMLVHSGHTVHQIAPAKNIQPNDERITLQGHGIFSQGSWQLYW